MWSFKAMVHLLGRLVAGQRAQMAMGGAGGAPGSGGMMMAPFGKGAAAAAPAGRGLLGKGMRFSRGNVGAAALTTGAGLGLAASEGRSSWAVGGAIGGGAIGAILGGPMGAMIGMSIGSVAGGALAKIISNEDDMQRQHMAPDYYNLTYAKNRMPVEWRSSV